MPLFATSVGHPVGTEWAQVASRGDLPISSATSFRVRRGTARPTLAGGCDMLTIRRRGSAGKWYVRGTVTLGDRFIDVAEFSTGTTDEDAARHLMAECERALREELMFGPRVVLTRAVIADAFDVYLAKPKRPNSSDILRFGVMNERIGSMALSDPRAAWRAFQDAFLAGLAPAGQDRYRSLLPVARIQ
ncbi:hypothetical protein EAH79_17130 [Sphingomonas koreensis]|nr:hypothetical protein EAH79_17130 [Sphingomonas koreensis]